MSRWSRKTQEEKEQILQKQEDQKEEQQINKDRMNYLSTDWRMKILKEHELPLFCKKHGWTHSERYILISRKDMFGKHGYILGKCPRCNLDIETIIPVNIVYTPLFALVMTDLIRTGKLKDRRK